jgi:TolB-like protein
MRSWTPALRRGDAVIALTLVALVATAITLGWRRTGKDSGTSDTSITTPPVLVTSWRAVGRGVEPWSGVGLGEEVRRALTARGFVVADGGDSGGRRANDLHALASLGRERHATYVLGATVGRKGERSEIGMQLVRVQDSAPVWSSTFWRDPSDLVSLATDLAFAVSQVLESERSARGVHSR